MAVCRDFWSQVEWLRCLLVVSMSSRSEVVALSQSMQGSDGDNASSELSEVESRGVSAADSSLFRRIYPELRRFAAATASSDLDPDDLVMAAIAQRLGHGSLTDLDDPCSYLRSAIFNLASNERRRLGRFRSAVDRIRPDRSHHDRYPSDLDLLGQLRAADRALLYLVDVEGRTFSEAAALIGVGEQAARARASRARRQLRRWIDQEDRFHD